jgi:hypothetical protein
MKMKSFVNSEAQGAPLEHTPGVNASLELRQCYNIQYRVRVQGV